MQDKAELSTRFNQSRLMSSSLSGRTLSQSSPPGTIALLSLGNFHSFVTLPFTRKPRSSPFSLASSSLANCLDCTASKEQLLQGTAAKQVCQFCHWKKSR